VKARKYKESYRLVEDGARPGQRRAEYTGSYYRYPEGSLPQKRRALRAALWVGCYWLAALAYLKTGRATSRCLYALVPFMIGVIPGAYALMGLFTALRAPERMTVVQRENGPGRITRAALGCGVFSSAGCVGCAVFILTNGLVITAWHELMLTAAAGIAAWLAFAKSRADYRDLAAQGQPLAKKEE